MSHREIKSNIYGTSTHFFVFYRTDLIVNNIVIKRPFNNQEEERSKPRVLRERILGCRSFTGMWDEGGGQNSESWTIKKAEHQRIDAFKLCCWRRLSKVPWISRRSNQSILEEINPECSLEGLMLMLKLQYFGCLM